MARKHHIPAEHFMEQFHNHHHYVEHGPDESHPEWWELPEPRKRGGRVDFRNGGRAGYALSGRVEQLGRDLHQSFGDLNRQVAAAPQQQAPAGGDYKAMLERATQPSLSPDYQAMVNKALEPSGKTYEEMFPANVKPYTPAAPVAAAAPAAAEQPADANKWMTDYGSWMTSLMGGGGDGLKRGGKVNIVERALAVTRRK